jgi:predicted house-cleaning NTP pyrophosphatase (Maf/HAM1 superfamily)
MRRYSDAEIRAYIRSGDPMDKAGAYAIQHPGFHPVEALQGCFANVMGLPLCHLARTLSLVGVPPLGDIAGECQAEINYTCPIFQQVLQRTI